MLRKRKEKKTLIGLLVVCYATFGKDTKESPMIDASLKLLDWEAYESC